MAESKRAHRYLKGSLKFLVITTLVIIVSYGLLNVVAETQETATALLQAMGSIESKLRYLRWLLLAVITDFIRKKYALANCCLYYRFRYLCRRSSSCPNIELNYGYR